MIKKALLVVGLFVGSISTATQTATTFKAATQTQQDEYGNDYFQREATISTANFKVDNFWNNFNENGTASSNYKTISRSGIFKITTSSTSACTLDSTLDSEGCSGQKPFLLNDEVLNNPIAGTTDTFEVAFTEASNYNNNDYNGFYPLDILRDAKYYKDTTNPDDPTTGKTGFFGFITRSFDYLFNKVVGINFFGQQDIADVQEGVRSGDAQDRRQRYIANIIAGLEKEHRVTKNANEATATQINAPTLNTPASLLHYAEAQKSTTTTQCKFMFIKLSAEGAMCRIMSGFGMDAWMPFFNLTHTTQIQSNFILGDTENALLAMTSQIEDVPYMKDVGGSDENKLSFLQNIIKPMVTMVDIMKNMMFGTDKKEIVSNPVERVYKFNENEAMTMTFPITNDGTQIDDFAHFKLLKIRSVYADEINACTVKKVPGMISPSAWEDEFIEGGTLSHKSPNSRVWKKEVWDSDQWINWCQEAANKKGMFDYLFDWSTGGFINPLNWMKGMFSAFLIIFTGQYEITDFKNSIQRGLILDLKKVDLDPISIRNTREIKILNINTPSSDK